MAGRKWFEGSIEILLVYRAPQPTSADESTYLLGILDTLGGCHGPALHLPPIIYLNDSQVVTAAARPEIAAAESYEVTTDFLQRRAPSFIAEKGNRRPARASAHVGSRPPRRAAPDPGHEPPRRATGCRRWRP